MSLSKYIKISAAIICAAVTLITGGIQTASDNEWGVGEPVVPCTTEQEITTQASTENIPETSEETTQEYVTYFSDNDVTDMAKVLYRECGGVSSKTEQACVAWCVLNRVDQNGSSIYKELRAPNQFAFYESTEVKDDMLDLARDVLTRWNDEKNGKNDVGRVLPPEYTYFHGDGVHNYFRNAFSGDYDTWDYSLNSPYEN